MAEDRRTINDITAALAKSVVPDTNAVLKKSIDAFRNAVTKQVAPGIDKSFNVLKNQFQAFNKSFYDLGRNFENLEKYYDGLVKQREDKEREAAELRQQNIFSELKLVKNRKTGIVEYRNLLLTEKQVQRKTEQLLAREKKLKDEEKELLKKVRELQKQDDTISKRKSETVMKELQRIKGEKEKISSEKGDLTDRKGKFPPLIGGFLDDFENTLNDRAPDFLVTALSPIIDIARQFTKTISLFRDGISLVTTGFKKVGPMITEQFGRLAGGFKTIGKSLLLFNKRILLAGRMFMVAAITALAPLIAALAPFLPAILGIVAGIAVIAAKFVLIKKLWEKIIDGIKNSKIYKFFFGKKDEKEQEPKDEKKGFFKKEKKEEKPKAVLTEDKKKEKPKAILTEDKKKELFEEKDAFGDSKFESFMQDKEMDAYMKGEETTSMKKNRVRQETEALRKEKIYGDSESGNKIRQLAKEKYGGDYDKAKAELYPELVAKEKELEALIKKEEEEKLAAKKAFIEKSVIPDKRVTKSTKKTTTSETVTGGKETVTGLSKEQLSKIDDRNKIHREYEDKIMELMDSSEYKKMGKDERINAIVALENERNKLLGEAPLKDFQVQTIKNGVEFELRQEKKIAAKGGKKDLTLDADTAGKQVVVNQVTAPQNAVSTSTTQVLPNNAAKSNDDTFLNLNRASGI